MPVQQPAMSGIQRVLESSKIGMATIYKLMIGGAILLLLLMTLLPEPRDPLDQSSSSRLAFPFGTPGHALGGDQLGRDVLSRLMSGGRYLLFRLALVGLIVVGATVLVRRRLRKRAEARGAGPLARGPIFAVTPMLVMLTTICLALSVAVETAIGLFGALDALRYLGPVGRILLGVPPAPPTATWGSMLADGRAVGVQAPWLAIFPLVGLVLVIAGIVMLGSGIVDILTQRARKASP
jgi:ABC-type dipeptide/oligopeptide/nickel transport system permease subunit